MDGHGHVYVFPRLPEELREGNRPVDVFSRDGERLFAGLIEPNWRSWTAAASDYFYGVPTDPDTKEWVIVRYRLVEPFSAQR